MPRIENPTYAIRARTPPAPTNTFSHIDRSGIVMAEQTDRHVVNHSQSMGEHSSIGVSGTSQITHAESGGEGLVEAFVPESTSPEQHMSFLAEVGAATGVAQSSSELADRSSDESSVSDYSLTQLIQDINRLSGAHPITNPRTQEPTRARLWSMKLVEHKMTRNTLSLENWSKKKIQVQTWT